MNLHKHVVYIIAIAAVLTISFGSLQTNNAKPFHTRLEKEFLDHHLRSPIDSDQYFLGSIRCKGCHGFDTLHVANVDEDGVDINLYDDWQTSMMANSAKDPLWRAKVSHEILVDPAHASDLQTKCTSCHSPLGHFTAIYKGATSYTINDLVNDTLGLDGVSCGGCHEIGTQNLGTVFSGDIPYDTSKKEFGPFLNPLAGPMQLYEGLTPTYSEHMSKSQVCSSCHTLLTNTVDDNGNYTGNTFIEQATYHEWLNSALAQDNITCQHCHMPQITDSIIIANNILALGPRSPFNQHQFVGGNAFMIGLIKQNKSALGISAPDVNFDSTLVESYRMLQQNTLSLSLLLDSISMDTIFLRLKITNKAGHKFPSGYPSRRAVVQLVVTDPNVDTVFQSGTFDSNFEVNGIDGTFEPHYNIVNQPSQAQIYEMVMGDVNNNVTTVVERAAIPLKDNRLPPEGFTSAYANYDTVQVVGDAVTDPDFNKGSSGTEGTGIDYVHYHIPASSFTGVMKVYAGIYYQSVPPRWVEDMFAYSSAAIDTFRNMYLAADRAPILVSSTEIITPVISAVTTLSGESKISLLNTLSSNGAVTIENERNIMIYSLRIFDAEGNLLNSVSLNKNDRYLPIKLPEGKGIYLVEIQTREGEFIFKVVGL